MAPTLNNVSKDVLTRHIADNRYSMEWKYGPAENAQLDNHPLGYRAYFNSTTQYEDRSTGILPVQDER